MTESVETTAVPEIRDDADDGGFGHRRVHRR